MNEITPAIRDAIEKIKAAGGKARKRDDDKRDGPDSGKSDDKGSADS